MAGSTTNISIRMDSDLKAQADILFGELGMNLSTAFNIFVRQSLREGRIPFDISLNQPNKETIAAMLEAERIAKDPSVKGYTDLDELFADLKTWGKQSNTVKPTTQFKKDYKLAIKRGLNFSVRQRFCAYNSCSSFYGSVRLWQVIQPLSASPPQP